MPTRRSNIVPVKMSDGERAAMSDEKILTAGQAAKFLGVTTDQLRHYRALKQIEPYMEFDYETLYRVADLRNVNIQPTRRGPKPKKLGIDKLTDIC